MTLPLGRSQKYTANLKSKISDIDDVTLFPYLKYDYEDIDNDLYGVAGERVDYEQKLPTITEVENKVSLVENWEYKTIEYKQFIEDIEW